jgi:hypothetical protein
MPKYKLILTVQDSFGLTKEIEAGIVDATEYELTESELNNVVERLPLDSYVKKVELPEELEEYATDIEVDEAVKPTVKHGGFKFKGASE